MSLVQTFKCANYDCKNFLSDFELKRIVANRWNRYRYCHSCRMFSSGIVSVRCSDCGVRIHATQTFKIPLNHLCLLCKKKHNTINAYRYFEKHRKSFQHTSKIELKLKKISNLLQSGDFFSTKEIAEEAGLKTTSVRVYMDRLRKKNHKIGSGYYYFLESLI